MNLSFIFSVCILSFILSSSFSLLIFKQLTFFVITHQPIYKYTYICDAATSFISIFTIPLYLSLLMGTLLSPYRCSSFTYTKPRHAFYLS